MTNVNGLWYTAHRSENWNRLGIEQFSGRVLRDEEFEIMNTGIKPYPCCRYNHGPIDAVMELASENRLESDAIASMDLDHVLNDTMKASLSPVSIDLKTYGERKK